MYIFSTPNYESLAKEIASINLLTLGQIQTKVFSDGETYHRILNSESLINQDVTFVCGTTNSDSILDLYNIASALVACRIKKLHLVIPYFGYSTMERAVKPGEVVKAKSIAKLFSSIPQATQGNFIYLIDAHTEGLPHYFEGESHVVHLYAKDEVKAMISSIGKPSDLVLASTDAGRAKWVESLANEFGMQAAFVLKRRDDSGTEVTAINADVKDRDVIIYDDMVRSGSSVIKAAQAYKAAGANKIYVCCTHGIFCDNGLIKLSDSSLIERVFTTNTHSNVSWSSNSSKSFNQVVSVAGLIAKAIKSE